MENFGNQIMHINNDSKVHNLPYVIKNIMSNLIAIYWYENYQTNKEQTISEIEMFNNSVGTNDIDQVNNKVLTDTFKAFDEYTDSVVLSRTRK